MSNTSKTIRGLSYQTLLTISMGVIDIIVFSIMSRILTREDFGVYAAIAAITAIFYSIAEAGIGSAIIQTKDVSVGYRNTAFTLSFTIGFIIAAIMSLAADNISILIVDERLKIPIIMMSTTIFFNGLLSVFLGWMYRQLQFLRVGIIQIVSLVVSSLFGIYLAYNGYGYYSIVYKGIIYSLLSLLIAFFFVGTKFKFELKSEYIKSIINFGGWLTASVIIRNVAQQIDRLMMSKLLSVSMLGAYNRPKDFVSQISNKLNGIFDTVLFPILSSIQDDNKSIISSLKKSMYFLNLFSFLLCAFFIFNSRLIIKIFLGEEWMDLNLLLKVISLSLIINMNTRIGDCYLRSLALVKAQFYIRLAELLLMIMAVVVFYRWGLVSIALSVIMVSVVSLVFKIMYISNKVGCPLFNILVIILKSWRFSILLVPLMLIITSLAPQSLFGDIVVCFCFISISLIIFLFLPFAVGREYKEGLYKQIISYIKNKTSFT